MLDGRINIFLIDLSEEVRGERGEREKEDINMKETSSVGCLRYVP